MDVVFTAYILESQIGKGFYIGHTQDLNNRMHIHNSGRSKYTHTGAPWKVVFSTSFKTRKEAAYLEKRIKKTGARSFLSTLGYI